MTNKNQGSKQADMHGLFNPKTGAMRRLREVRRDAGFIEVSVWVPLDQKEEIKRLAANMVSDTGKELPSVSDKEI